MAHRTAPSRRQQIAVLATAVALHAVLIALFFQQSVKVAPVVKPTSVAIVALDAERPVAAKPPPPTLPAKLAETFKPLIEFSFPVDSESDSPAGASGVCATPQVVLDALLLDPAALAAIRSAPPETRSVADAIVIWNEGWSPAALAPHTPLFSVRVTMEQSLSAVIDGCLDEPVVGPRLLPVPDAGGTRTIFLVFGSGNWTWRALLTPALPATDGALTVPITSAGAK